MKSRSCLSATVFPPPDYHRAIEVSHPNYSPIVFQVDDDSYVRVGALLARIAETSSERTFLGFIENPGGGPHRNKKSQWYVKPEEWPSDRYPPWAHGAGYVLSQVSSTDLFQIWASKIRYVRMACEWLHVGEYMKPVMLFLSYVAQSFHRLER